MECPNTGGNFNNARIIVKDSSSSIKSSGLSSNNLQIDFDGDGFYTISCSENINNAGTQSCANPALNENEYVLGQIVKRNLWSEELLANLESEYVNNYQTLKNELVPHNGEFEFAVWDLDSQTKLFQGNQPRKPSSSRIDAKTFSIDVLLAPMS